MATYVVTSTNWNDPSFWSAISEASGPNTLDFSALSSRYSVDLDAETDITTIYDSTSGTSYSIGGDGVSGTDTTLGLATHFSYFDTIYGSSGDDTLRGGTGNDFIDGGAGDDILEGDNGNDALFGGEGNDIFVINDDDGSDSVYGGETGTDFDAIAFANWITTGGVTVTFTGDEAGDYSFNGATADASGTFTGIEAIWGTAYDDTLDASASSTDQELVGHAGNDVITGGSGDDNIIGGTGDDTLTGGAGDDTFSYQAGDGVDIITDFNTGNSGALGDGDTTNNDFIDLSAFYDNIDELRADQADDGILNQSNDGVGGVDYSDNDSFGTGSLTFTGAETDPSFFTADNTGVVCFAAGTLIETPEGARPVETLRPGDLVSTLDNGSQVLRWVGTRDVSPEDMVRDPGLHPVVIEPGVLGAKRRLMVSQQHGVLLKPGLARATHLARHAAGIRIAKGVKHVRYHHLLFDRHQIVLAEGVPCESLYPGPQALAMLTSSGRASLAQHLPWLPEAMRDESLTDRAYGPTARVFLNRREVAEAMAPVLA